MRIIYVTSRFPYGPGEGFLEAEVVAHLQSGTELVIFPMAPIGGRVHSYVDALERHTEWGGTRRSLVQAARGVASQRRGLARGAMIVAVTGAPRVRARNVAVLPRAAALVDVIRRVRPAHVHVHWGGASSTLTMVACEATGTPWSMTLHRWDIRAGNLLPRKLASACFTRVISERGAADVQSLVPNARTELIHMGIDTAAPVVESELRVEKIACIASLVPVKGHIDLLHAFVQAAAESDVVLDLVGDGPLRDELAAAVEHLGLAGRVRFLGMLSHAEVLDRLRSNEWGAVILASTHTDDAHEGIPVSLMEAMAAGVPVVATDSGGTAELIGGGCGLLVPVHDRDALGRAIISIVQDHELRQAVALAARGRVERSFDAATIAQELRERFRECAVE
jgi:glycosyltransferase involved in cell wall biosynthesis